MHLPAPVRHPLIPRVQDVPTAVGVSCLTGLILSVCVRPCVCPSVCVSVPVCVCSCVFYTEVVYNDCHCPDCHRPDGGLVLVYLVAFLCDIGF